MEEKTAVKARGRVCVLSGHLATAAETSDSFQKKYEGDPFYDRVSARRANVGKNIGRMGIETGYVKLLSKEKLESMPDRSTVEFRGEPYDIADHLPGPLEDPSLPKLWLLAEIDRIISLGQNHIYYDQVQEKYCDQGMASNFVIPKVMKSPGVLAFITNHVILNDPDDCERFARTHLRKQPDFQNNGFGTSIISTNDDDYWREMRGHLVEAFLPIESLSKIFPVSRKRASVCATRLGEMAKSNAGVVDMSDFFLHETQAQLQLALFGETNEFMERTNKPFRDAFNGRAHDGMFVTNFLAELTERMTTTADFAAPSDAVASGCPIKGPVSRAVGSFDGDYKTLFGNGLIFAFAGHDTTGHTLTWLLFEMAKKPELQERLRAEVENFLAEQGTKPIEYLDLKRLRFMTRCIMETLRLWPAVANGTFRELSTDDVCKGRGGQPVHLPKGTYVQVSNWARHRNPDLWGVDVLDFNPDRDFTEDELWHNEGFSAYNPVSKRFSPFTFSPRHCIGMNFAQMEMRLILVNLMHNYAFTLTAPNADPASVESVNRGTLGPKDNKAEHTKPPKPGHVPFVSNGLYFNVHTVS